MEPSGNDAAAGLRLARFFNKDHFAGENGMRVVEVRTGYARTEMETCPKHLNAIGIVQGGAVFTLADLAFAACSNSHGVVAVACQVDITYFQAVRAGHLMATAEEIDHPFHGPAVLAVHAGAGVVDDLVAVGRSIDGEEWLHHLPGRLTGLQEFRVAGALVDVGRKARVLALDGVVAVRDGVGGPQKGFHLAMPVQDFPRELSVNLIPGEPVQSAHGADDDGAVPAED